MKDSNKILFDTFLEKEPVITLDNVLSFPNIPDFTAVMEKFISFVKLKKGIFF